MNLQDLERAEAEIAAMSPQFLKASSDLQAAQALLGAVYQAQKTHPENLELRRLLFSRLRDASEAAMLWAVLARKQCDIVEPVLDWMARDTK